VTTDITTTTEDAPRKIALLKAIGLDKLSDPARELAVAIANKYDLDLLLKHAVIIEGRLYITRDGLLHVAHRDGHFDGITVEPARLDGDFWYATASVYRKDMTHPFTYTGRYPVKGGNARYAPEMAVKVAEVAALRRAFDVAAPTLEERWDDAAPATDAPARRSLAEIAAEKAAAARDAVIDEAVPEPAWSDEEIDAALGDPEP